MNKSYVVSDIHGEYEKYLKLIKLIKLDDTDILYIIGDILDRGEKPISLLKDIMNRKNVIPIMGNHDLIAMLSLKSMNNEITEEIIEFVEKNLGKGDSIMGWLLQGGITTLNELILLSEKERKDILYFLENIPLYKEINVNGKEYILVHAGLGNFSPDKKLEDYSLEELCFHIQCEELSE